jgi:DNA-binding Lrp family transcriptional regulator
MTEEDLPDWTTELDEEILKLLNTELTLTPSVIAENINRSRGAVSRRLNALEAGGLVEKVSRGKYLITSEALGMLPGGWKIVEVSEEEEQRALEEAEERRKQIKQELGISEGQYLGEVSEEYERLRQDWEGNHGDLLEKAFEIVEKRHQSKRDR